MPDVARHFFTVDEVKQYIDLRSGAAIRLRFVDDVMRELSAMYLAVPRLPAIAEVAWTPQGARGWDGFRTRIAAHAPRWRLLGVNFHPSPQEAW